MKKRVEYTWNKITYYMCIRKLYMYITCFRILQNAVHAYPTAHSCIVSLSHSALKKIYMVFNVINNSLLLVHYIFCCVSTSPTWAVNPVILLNSLHMFFIMQLFLSRCEKLVIFWEIGTLSHQPILCLFSIMIRPRILWTHEQPPDECRQRKTRQLCYMHCLINK